MTKIEKLSQKNKDIVVVDYLTNYWLSWIY